jgi:acetoin utilization deacetylase AcuC-like enzyme
VRVHYSPAYVAAAHSFDTTRKAGWIAGSLVREPISGVELVEPAPLTAHDLREVHDAAYVDAVRTGRPAALAQSQGFSWDPALWQAVTASNGGLCAAAEVALREGVSGSLSSGLHHARRGHGAGFCTFNGLALAARRGARSGLRVLVLDLDAHCGGGTNSVVGREPNLVQVDVATNAYDTYAVMPPHTLEVVRTAAGYLPAIRRGLDGLDAAGPDFDLLLYNAGMDPHEGSTGGLTGITAAVLAEREALVFDWARRRGVPVAFCLAGGYVSSRLPRDELVALHRLTIAAAAA